MRGRGMQRLWCLGLGVVTVAVALGGTSAQAYPWMLKHDYKGCASCHVDPSGGSQLRPYGRAQADVLLRYKSKEAQAATEEAGDVPPSAGFLWGAWTPPEWLNLSGNVRGGALVSASNGSFGAVRPLWMAADLRAELSFEVVRAAATVGVGVRAAPAALSPVRDSNTPMLTSREHWLGAVLSDETLMVRAGRLNLPFGLRNAEHTSWIRAVTRTDINVGQQHGLAVAYNGEGFRGEVMGVAGNLQVAPDAYRERGGVGFVEYTRLERTALGASALVLTAQRDVLLGEPLLRQAYELYVRRAFSEAVSVVAELAVTHQQVPSRGALGYVGFAQLDWELLRGLHALATLETLDENAAVSGASYGGWLSGAFYFAPHAELRLDLVQRRLDSPLGATWATTVLGQLHFFL